MLLGRRRECATLDGVIGAIRRGESRTLVISGDAGIGKSALLDYLVTRATDCALVRISGIQSETEVSFAALHQLCGPIMNRLDRLPGPQREALRTVFGLQPGPTPDRLLVGLTLLGLLAEAADERPLVCVIDDAHWLDRTSSQAIAFAARRLVAESVALVLAHRISEAAPDLDALPHLIVERLDEPSSRALLNTVVSVRLEEQLEGRIVAETQGNPLAILELPRGLTHAELASGLLFSGDGGFTDELEAAFSRRVTTLPAATQQLLLVAAAESLGDVQTVRRAAVRLGIGAEAPRPAIDAGLWEFGSVVRFRHPLVRSAVYRGAAVDERRTVHSALAEVIESPDRRAWHRAEAATAPDETLAAELARAADGAHGRGGFGQAAAFLQQSGRMTPDPAVRAQREVRAAQAQCLAGDLDASAAALAAARAGPLDDAGVVHAELVSAQIALATNRGGDGALSLLRAAKKAESFDPVLARDTYLHALMAATFAGALPEGIEFRDFAEAAQPTPTGTPTPADLILFGLAQFFTKGYVVGAPPLRRALAAYRNEDSAQTLGLPWLSVAGQVTTALWDDEGFLRLSEQYLDGVRSAGALSALPIALDYRVFALCRAGDLSAAAALVEETAAVTEAIGQRSTPYGALMLYAWQGRATEADTLIESAIAEARASGIGLLEAIAHWTNGVLCNGLGRFDEALHAASAAALYHQDLSDVHNKALVEFIEASAYTGTRSGAAVVALNELSIAMQACGTDWSLGTEARCRALLAPVDSAEAHFREAVTRLSRTRSRADLARAHLLYGEWLRRRHRRTDAREQLRTASEMFFDMGMDGFAARAARELRATGAVAPERRVESSRGLTSQETQVARLASEGLSNTEIAGRLFLSPKTVEYHLHKIFTKLDITSRKDVAVALGALS